MCSRCRCCEYHESYEDAPRKQRLDAVRQVFHAAYSSVRDLQGNGLAPPPNNANALGELISCRSRKTESRSAARLVFEFGGVLSLCSA